MNPIGYLTEPVQEYGKDLDSADTLDKLKAVVKKWKPIACDAWEVVQGMTTENFVEFRDGLRKERKGKYAGEEHSAKYGAIILPELFIRVSMVSERFFAPWGTAFIRLKEEGYIGQREDGVYFWTGKENEGKSRG